MTFEKGEGSGESSLGDLYSAFLGAVAAQSEAIKTNTVRVSAAQITAVQRLDAAIKQPAVEIGQERLRQRLLEDMRPAQSHKPELGIIQGQGGASDAPAALTQLRIVQ